MSKHPVVAVFGYNNTRLYDVQKIKALVGDRCSAGLLLIKEGIGDEDRAITPFCLDHRPDDPDVSVAIRRALAEHSLELIACLPFSDKGVIGAAHAARDFGLVGDEPASSFAMVDKNLFRELEANIPTSDAKYKKPFFSVARSETELRNVFATVGTFFAKPTSEGNSRGCMKISSSEDLNAWLADNSAFVKQGVMCEEVLANDHEYSFDGVGGRYWITQKFTTSGAFRAEYQHIVPAPLEAKKSAEIHATLEPLLSKMGSNGGAFHHEFFLLNDGRVASVEPNRRPAGMWIWDLAQWAFEDFNPWTRWVDHCTQKSFDSTTPKPAAYAGVRGVISRTNGRITSIDGKAIEKELERLVGEGNYRLSILKDESSVVRDVPRDNSDFLAYVGLRHVNYEVLARSLDEANEIFLKHTEIAK